MVCKSLCVSESFSNMHRATVCGSLLPTPCALTSEGHRCDLKFHEITQIISCAYPGAGQNITAKGTSHLHAGKAIWKLYSKTLRAGVSCRCVFHSRSVPYFPFTFLPFLSLFRSPFSYICRLFHISLPVRYPIPCTFFSGLFPNQLEFLGSVVSFQRSQTDKQSLLLSELKFTPFWPQPNLHNFGFS